MTNLQRAGSPSRLHLLVHRLRHEPAETEWLELKVNNEDPDKIGQYISALANSAALLDKSYAYMVWGIDDRTHEIVGTDFDPAASKGKGNEDLEPWLLRGLTPQVNFNFSLTEIDGKRVVILRIPRATMRPIAFGGQEFIRVASYKKPLRDAPEKERALWRAFDQMPFEKRDASDELDGVEVLSLLDYPAYFDLLKLPLPENRDGILSALAEDGLIYRTDNGSWIIRNLGATLFAKKLSDFESLARKAVRVIQYKSNDRTVGLKEQVGTKGYAAGFEGLVGYINSLVPSNEVIKQAVRSDLPMYPEIAIRELVANALIHQDFAITGAGPMIEIFADRMEITNPGRPLMPVDRLLDKPPRSRNESLAGLMRRIGVCEERGSGIDRVVNATEAFQLPAPEFMEADDSLRVTLFAYLPYNKMDRADKLRACYLHACLRYVLRDYMTNTSLRERFGIAQNNSAIVSRLIKDSIEAGYIQPHSENAGKRFMKYVPFWAK